MDSPATVNAGDLGALGKFPFTSAFSAPTVTFALPATISVWLKTGVSQARIGGHTAAKITGMPKDPSKVGRESKEE